MQSPARSADIRLVVPHHVLSARAREDIKDIGRYTEQRWGHAQRRRYLLALDKRFRALARRPESGAKRDRLRKGYRSALQGSHVIYYRMIDGGIEIVRVLHHAMDVEIQMKDEN